MRWFWQKNEADDMEVVELNQDDAVYVASEPEDEEFFDNLEDDAIMGAVIFQSQTADRFE